ncbi:CPBP family intramembrane metalloprotease [Nocardia sp. NEAU-G5]|uniref:CPBP family intramembrane metalloprotease n=1 Tax=Nocardia albiluteola TaxID=2842303 RepID=A0ABS6B6D9_9NOCA|nr:type II CAAX endopeptidase family protein [Nocardia albiluteola]MBU3065884.1 CPBP family intramembrane metalloprotease [Nocardia albiluteola]
MTNRNELRTPPGYQRDDPRSRAVKELWYFVPAAYIGAWLVATPLWLTGFRREAPSQHAGPLVAACLFTMMVVPAAVSILLTRWRHPWRDVPRILSLGLPRPRRRVVAQCLWASIVFVAITLVGLIPAALSGVYRPAWPQSAWSLLTLPLSAIVSLPLYLGEEIGWQGYMMPRLTLRFGTVTGICVGGVLWGLWHLPMTALGGSYPGHPLYVAIPTAVAVAVAAGAIIAVIRIRTHSVWPAVAAHLGLNEFALPLPQLTAASDHAPDPLFVGPLSLITWPIMMVAGGMALYTISGAGHRRGLRGTGRKSRGA